MTKKSKLILFTALLWLAVPKATMATAQIPDLLIVGSDTLWLFCNPLEGYFDEKHPRPNDMWGIGSTACWRGYQAYFEIKSDSLFLTGIRLGEKGDSSGFYNLTNLFGDKATPDGVFAYWVNGILACVGGKCLFYIHMGYASMYEFDIEYTIQQGIVKKKQVFDNRKSFLPYGSNHDRIGDISSLFVSYVESQIDYSRLAPYDLGDMVEVTIDKVDDNGRIKRVKMNKLLTSHKQRKAIRRALKNVPRFNVLYYRGKPVDEIHWRMDLKIYKSKEEQAKHYPTNGPDIGIWSKEQMLEDVDYVGHLEYLSGRYHDTYKDWKDYIADTSAFEQQYKDYFCQLFGDSLLYQHHYFMTLGDSALKYYYQYWDMTGDHESLYPIIIGLEQELNRPHNPKIVKEKNPEFVYYVLPDEMDNTHQADSSDLHQRCRQVSYHLRGFGEGDLHDPLPDGVQEVWRLLLLRGSYKEKSPMVVKVIIDGMGARIAWRIAKEYRYETYPGLDYFKHGIQSEGERQLTDEEWKQMMALSDEAGIDTLHLDNDYFSSPPAIYNVEHRTTTGYHVVNDYNHPYYNEEINPLFWPFRAFCKYLITLVDPSLPFDSDDKR